MSSCRSSCFQRGKYRELYSGSEGPVLSLSPGSIKRGSKLCMFCVCLCKGGQSCPLSRISSSLRSNRCLGYVSPFLQLWPAWRSWAPITFFQDPGAPTWCEHPVFCGPSPGAGQPGASGHGVAMSSFASVPSCLPANKGMHQLGKASHFLQYPSHPAKIS